MHIGKTFKAGKLKQDGLTSNCAKDYWSVPICVEVIFKFRFMDFIQVENKIINFLKKMCVKTKLKVRG